MQNNHDEQQKKTESVFRGKHYTRQGWVVEVQKLRLEWDLNPRPLVWYSDALPTEPSSLSNICELLKLNWFRPLHSIFTTICNLKVDFALAFPYFLIDRWVYFNVYLFASCHLQLLNIPEAQRFVVMPGFFMPLWSCRKTNSVISIKIMQSYLSLFHSGFIFWNIIFCVRPIRFQFDGVQSKYPLCWTKPWPKRTPTLK